MRNYLTLICLVCFDDNILPFFSKDKALMLSLNMMHSSILYPWHSTKYLIHITSLSLSWRAIISVLVELFVMHFYLFEELATAPAPKVTRLPVCPQQSSCTWCDPSIYQCIVKFIVSVLIVSLRYLVPFRYFRTLLSFPQSSSSGACTCVVRNNTTVWMSQQALFAANSSWYTVWWIISAYSLFSVFPSSLTLRK